MANVGKGHIERLPSGSYRVRVYAGNDPLTGKEIRLKATAKTAEHAHAELARLLEQASTGQQPESAATVGYLLDQYMAVADLDVLALPASGGQRVPAGIPVRLGVPQREHSEYPPARSALTARPRNPFWSLRAGRSCSRNQPIPRVDVFRAGDCRDACVHG